jgi:hypothetical protein
MAEDYLSIRNSYAIDVDDPGIATLGISKFFMYIYFVQWEHFGKETKRRFCTMKKVMKIIY